ncbi:MAG: single-stranded DNA-binding protein [Bacillota bacterium]|nr:single-stranded DNA-binding protein [Bacillota bacterium]
MLNKIILIGRLVADPELRYTQSGIAVTKFTLAVDRPFTSQSGEKEADFIDVVTWRKQAEVCANHLHKGRLVAVEGRLQIRSYDDSNGIRRKAAEVVADNVRFLDKVKDSSCGSADSPPEPEFDDVPF